jgi:1-acyl-sn-glycerol-3-phosphate acyltransferase
MSDMFYNLIRFIGRPVFWLSSSPTVLHADRLNGRGAMILAPNHLSPYDVPCLMASTPRKLDFVSVVEFFRNPLSAWFLKGMNAFPLDRGRRDPAATRKILERLERGRTVAMFPEGQIRTAESSLLAGGAFKASVTRLARLANVPIVPCVVLATGAFAKPQAWLPLRRTRYGVNFGEPLHVSRDGDEEEACAQAAAQLKRAYDEVYAELRAASGLTVTNSPWRKPRGSTIVGSGK